MIRFSEYIKEEFNPEREKEVFKTKLNSYKQKTGMSYQELFDIILEQDPTSDKQKSYSRWLLGLVLNGKQSLDSIQHSSDLLKRYHELKIKKILKGSDGDVARLNSLGELADIVDKYIKKKENKDYLNKLPPKDSKWIQIYEDSKVLIIQLLNHKASCFYNNRSSWCTSASGSSGKIQFENYFPLFVIIPKKESYPGELYQYGKFRELKNEKNKPIENFKYQKELNIGISKYINSSEENQLAAVSKNGYTIQFIENPSEKVQMTAVSKDGYALQFIENPSEKIQLAAVSQDGYAIQFIKNPSEKVQLAAISKSAYSIELIKNPSEKIQMAAVSKDGYTIQFIKNPSEKIQLAAVSQDGYAIELIKNPSEKIQLAAVSQDGYAIKYIQNPTEKVQLAAISQYGDSIDFIENPSEKVKIAAKNWRK